jgi:putative Mg2+ transporter-C (MgtC) family protein
MVMVGIGSAAYMLLAGQLTAVDASSVSRTLQGFLSGIGFLGGAVIFKTGLMSKASKQRRRCGSPAPLVWRLPRPIGCLG